jgi:two-component sensor histidine kinase
MDHRFNHDSAFDRLRQQAEELIRRQPETRSPPPSDILGLIHELKLHQAELEIQNEELQAAQHELAELHHKYADLYEFAPCGYLTLDGKGLVTEANRIGMNLIKAAKSSLSNTIFSTFIESGWEHVFLAARQRAAESGEKQSFELPLKREGGRPLWVQAEMKADRDASSGAPLQWRLILVDISARKEAEMSLQEKEVLLKEIHHRVKNNMQVISSLISLQADELPAGDIRSVFQDVSHRVRSMALVHEKLYQAADLSQIEFDDYIRGLLRYLLHAFETTAVIRMELDLDQIRLPVNIALPCGLILNELICNALKHAFPKRDEGLLYISLHAETPNRVSLCIRDNGIGVPENFNWREANTMGLRLVRMLEQQLQAEILVSFEKGCAFTITFDK